MGKMLLKIIGRKEGGGTIQSQRSPPVKADFYRMERQGILACVKAYQD